MLIPFHCSMRGQLFPHAIRNYSALGESQEGWNS
jgi:hypothetical protein